MQQINYIVERAMRFYQSYGNGSVNVTVMRDERDMDFEVLDFSNCNIVAFSGLVFHEMTLISKVVSLAKLSTNNIVVVVPEVLLFNAQVNLSTSLSCNVTEFKPEDADHQGGIRVVGEGALAKMVKSGLDLSEAIVVHWFESNHDINKEKFELIASAASNAMSSAVLINTACRIKNDVERYAKYEDGFIRQSKDLADLLSKKYLKKGA